MSNEVKRWNLAAAEGPGMYAEENEGGQWMKASDHERIVAEKDAEIEYQKRCLADAMSGCCDCPTFKAQGKTVANQAKAIEKLKAYAAHKVDCICRAGVLQYSDDCDCGLEAIEKGEV